MPWSALGPGLVAALLAAPPGAPPPAAGRPALSVAWTDLVGLPPAVQDLAVRELRTVLAQAGIDVHVRRREATEEMADPEEIALAVVRGPKRRTARGQDVLGAVLRSPVGHPIAWIHVAAIRQTLGLAPEGGAALPLETRELGLAIGRVAAHEVVHLVLPGRPHAATGLMSEGLGRAALTGSEVLLDPATRQAVCAAASFRS